MFDRELLTNHIKDQETVFKIRQVIDKIEITQDKHIITYTDFLDPYERRMAISIINRFEDIKFMECGGHKDAERKIIVVYPYYMDHDDINEGLEYLSVLGHDTGLKHKDYLGTILGLGIKREKIGDIYIHEALGNIIVKSEIADYILLNLERIKNQKIEVKKISKSEIVKIEDDYTEENHFISSFRLDSIISAAFKLSRNESLDYIKGGLIKVNHERIEKASKELAEGDLVSVRGKGRFTLYKINGQSKKGRYNIVLRKLK